MNTPTHVVLGMIALGRRHRPRLLAPLALGGVLPDAPMFVFYLVERIWRGRPERWLWTEGYSAPHWQDFFDLFNSLPLIGLAFAIAWRRRAERWMALLLAMALHCAADLLVHNDDAHRHFFPMDWRFASPVSYWDPDHFGMQFAAFELVMGFAGCVHLWRTHSLRWVRALAALLMLSTVLGAAVGLLYWLGPR